MRDWLMILVCGYPHRQCITNFLRPGLAACGLGFLVEGTPGGLDFEPDPTDAPARYQPARDLSPARRGELPVDAASATCPRHLPSRVDPERLISSGELANRFLEVLVYRRKPLLEHLSGLALEYAVVQIYTREKGKKEARIGFHVGQGTQDIGFRNVVDILFECRPAARVGKPRCSLVLYKIEALGWNQPNL